MRRLGMMLAVVAVLVGGAAPVAHGATKIGWLDTAGTPTLFDESLPCPPRAYAQYVSSDTSYLVPSGRGVVTSFSVYGGTTGIVQLQLLRVAPGVDRYRAVGLSDPAPAAAGGWNTFPTRLPAEGGDQISLVLRTAGFLCLFDTGNLSDFMANLEGSTSEYPFPLGSEVEAQAGIGGVAVNLGATVEPDPDRDGWGNETQDYCLVAAGPDHGCPLPPEPPAASPPSRALKVSLRIGRQDVVRQQGLLLTVRAAEAAGLVTRARLRALGSGSAWNLLPAQGRLEAATRHVVKLKLSPRAAATLPRALENGARLRAEVTAVVTGPGGDTATIQQTVPVRD